MANVQTLEQALEDLQAKAIKKEKLAVTKVKPTLVRKNVSEVREVNTPKNNASKIANDAKSVLNFYITKIPDVKILDNQIELLKKEIIVYNKNKSTDNLAKSKTMLSELVEKRNNINKIFNRNGYSLKDDEKRLEILNNIKNSDTIKELRVKQKALELKSKEETPNSIMGVFSKLKKQLRLIDALKNNVILDIDDLDFLDDNEKTKNQLETEFYDYCLFIGKIIGKKNSEIAKMKNAEIVLLLREKLNNTQTKKDLALVKMQIAHEKNKLAGAVTVTELIYNIFDFKTDTTEGKIPKDILASTHVGLVNAIAYKQASSLNKLHELNDAVCGGMLGLTVAINTWYELQKISSTPLSFKDFANLHIANYAKRALYELSITGTTGSGKATMDTHEKQKFEDFVRYNPQFADMDRNVIIDMLDHIDETSKKKSLRTIVETDYNAMVGGEDETVDMYSINDFDKKDYDPDEARENYIKLIQSISQLMELFATKTNKVTGIGEVTNKKLFDKYDRKIFMMMFGIDYKRERSDSANKTKDYYKQAEMAVEVQAMLRADGQLNKKGEPATMTQEAIAARIKNIEIKIKLAMKDNPNLSMGFRHLCNYWFTNTGALKEMSNYREEIGISIDREELKEIYSDNDQQLNRELTDGKRLSDMFEITETNPFDEEIAGLFNDYI